MVGKILNAFQEQRYEQVCEYYKQVDRKTLDVEIQYIVAISFIFCEQYEVALDQIIRIKANAKQLSDYFIYIALCYLKIGDYNRSNYYLNKKNINKYSTLYYELKVELNLKFGKAKGAQYYINLAEKKSMLSNDLKINWAVLLMSRQQYEKAEALLLSVVDENFYNIPAIDNLIRIYKNKNRQANRLILEKYLAYDEYYLPYLWELVQLYVAEAKHEKIEPLLERIKVAEKDDASIREVFLIPSNYDSIKQIEDYRERIEKKLDQVIRDKQFPLRADKTYRCTPFYLSYHHLSNRNILEKIYKLMSKRLYPVPEISPKKDRPKKKIAVISQHFYSHSVMDFYLYTIENLPKEFDVTVIYIDPYKVDHITKRVKARADHYIQPSTNQEELIPLISNAQFDMIIYPEIGMSPVIYYLAMQRLAPKQIVLIGHPETSGMTSIDYYVSWKMFHFEDMNPQSGFTEQLIKLNQIPIYYDWPKELEKKVKSKKELNLPESPAKIYFVPMLLFKVHPSFDDVIERILKNDPLANIIFICFNWIEEMIQSRLKKRLDKEAMDRIIFNLPYSRADYFSVLRQADVALETFPFGGGNTILQCMASGVPIISLKGELLRGMFGTGLYRFINQPQYIADSVKEYADKCIAIANDSTAKNTYQEVITKNKNRLFESDIGVKEFYDWLRKIVV